MGDMSSSSSSAATAVVSSPATNIISSSFGHPLSTVLTVKLDEKNYLLWRGMVLAILRGQKVDGYVVGTRAQPHGCIEVETDSGKKTEPNPLYEEWVTVDQALSGWLFG